MAEENKNITVIKRDDSKEPFNQEKLMRIAIATGLPQEEANPIIEEIYKWAKEKGTVKSTEIRKMFSDKIREKNEYSANLYDWYQKVKKKNEDTDKEFPKA